MQLRGPDLGLQNAANAADGAAGAPAPVPAHIIIGLTDDPLLLEALSGAAAADSTVITCPTADRFIDQLVANAADIVLIDASSVSVPLTGLVATVREQFPQSLMILAGPAHVQAQLSAQISDGTIFRFVHKPASSQRLRLFLDAALRQQREEGSKQAPATVVAAASAVPAQRGGKGRGALTLVALCGAALAVAAIAWVVLHKAAPSAAVAPAAVDGAANAPVIASPAGAGDSKAAPAAAERDQLLAETQARDAAALEQAQRAAVGARADQLGVYLQLARKRLASGALIEPADDNARAYLASAAALAPDDADVHAVSVALGEALISQFRHALAAGEVAEAQHWLQACSDFRIGSATLSELSAQLKQLQTKQAQTDTLQRLQREFNQRLADAALLEPASDSALSKYRSLKSMDAGNAALPGMEHNLRVALAAAAQTRLTHDDPGGAEQLLNAARDAGLDGEEIATARRALESARAAASAPPPPSAPAAAPAWVSETTLTRVHFVAPEYPADALSKNVVGWVDLEFTVTAEGKVKDILILAAEPKGEFEQAARSAISRCRYSPVMRNGAAIDQRARIRVRFQL